MDLTAQDGEIGADLLDVVSHLSPVASPAAFADGHRVRAKAIAFSNPDRFAGNIESLPKSLDELRDRSNVSWAAAEACVQTHGGFGFAEEYDIERKFRETRLYQVAPISTNLILSYLGEHVLGMPRSY